MNAVDRMTTAAAIPSVRPHERRKIDSDQARVRVVNIVLPGHTDTVADAIPGERIGDFLRRVGWAERHRINGKMRWCFRLTTVCALNGAPLLQRLWLRRRIKVTDELCFISKPWGGGGNTGKMIAAIVATIAIAVIAPWAGSLVGGVGGLLVSASIPAEGGLLLSPLLHESDAAPANIRKLITEYQIIVEDSG